jgi:hypothetical protein
VNRRGGWHFGDKGQSARTLNDFLEPDNQIIICRLGTGCGIEKLIEAIYAGEANYTRWKNGGGILHCEIDFVLGHIDNLIST